MVDHRGSYRKSILLAGVGCVAIVVSAALVGTLFDHMRSVVSFGAAVFLFPLVLTIAGGFVVLHRYALLASGKRDCFLASGDSRNEASIAAGRVDIGLRVRRLLRAAFAPRRLLVGDRVCVRSLDEIRATLDASGCVDGLPFMPEMARFCGRQASVFRRVDKIYDYGGKKNLRRMRKAVLLQGMRCDGSDHGGCQAACYVLWKEEWLRPINASKQATAKLAADMPDQLRANAGNSDRYACQFTSFVAASTPIKPWDPRADLRPLVSGNVTLRGWLAVMLTRWFNYVQGIRGGVPFPAIPVVGRAESSVPAAVMPGTEVVVRSPAEIAATLDKNSKNRGLWFDRDMLKHSGHRYTVLRRVDRIIDDVTGKMRTMKTPCIVLDGVNYSGEGLRFCAQEENLYWREAWLTLERHAPAEHVHETMKAAS